MGGPRKKPLNYPREHAHAGSISRVLASSGNELYEHTGNVPGFEIHEFSKAPCVVILEIRGLDRNVLSRDKQVDKRAEMLKRLWDDAINQGYFVAWAWTSNFLLDTTRLLVSGFPIVTQYEVPLAPGRQDPLPGSPLEGQEPPALGQPDPQVASSQEEIERMVYRALSAAGHRPGTGAQNGFGIAPAPVDDTGAAVVNFLLAEGQDAGLEEDDITVAGRSIIGDYHTSLREAKIPALMLPENYQRFGTVLAGIDWNSAYQACVDLMHAEVMQMEDNATQEWQNEREELNARLADARKRLDAEQAFREQLEGRLEQAREAARERPVEPPAPVEVLTDEVQPGPPQKTADELRLEGWEFIADLFISPDQVEEAITAIDLARNLGRDAAARAMEHRLYTQVLHAIAAGSPFAGHLAMSAIKTLHLYFDRS